MRTDRAWLVAVAIVPLLAACEHDFAGANVNSASRFGDANRQTMMAQVVDPDPRYETLNPPTSGEHAGQSAERYRNDKVKKPDRVKSTQVSNSGGGSGN
jgi:hypothetical protein